MTSSDKTPPLTEWLRDWQQSGDVRLDDRLLEGLYAELRHVALQRLARESRATITPTELVHETWLRLKPPNAPIADRSSFLRLASVAMRHLLIDQARERLAQKRHAVMQTITVSLADNGMQQPALDDTQLLDLDRALDVLADSHPRAAEAIMLRAFAGLDLHELADALRISLATAKRDLAFGRAWLTATLKEEPAR
ncbi:MAG TPA: ECF-type sigma factor [Rhodanobacteraceae bacterium]